MKGPRLVRAIGLGIACLGVLWFSIAVTAAGVFRGSRPDLALGLMPVDARAMGKAALNESTAALMQLARTGRPQDMNAARARAQAALARDPTAIDAVAALGLVAVSREDQAGAERLFHYAERLSRRNPETQIWLIERQVSRNNIDGALAQYDTALRTSQGLRAQLFPILMSAMSDPDIARRLNRLLLTRPNWYPDFAAKVAWEGRDPAAMVTVTRGLLDPANSDHRQWLSAMLPRLVQLNRTDLAWQAYEGLAGMAEPARAPLRDGIFAVDAGLPPFDWAYATEPHLAPERRGLGGASSDGYALYLPETDQGGDVAWQALRLPPGAHRLAATVGNVSGEVAQRPYVQIRCAARDGAMLTRVLFPNAGEAGAPMQAAFSVPAGCPYQLISIGVQARPGDERSGSAWIARLSLL